MVQKIPNSALDGNRPFRNLLINGDMKIWQRYGGSAVTISDGSNEGYNSVDRWSMSFGSSAGGAIQWSRSTDVPAGEDFEYSLKMSPSTTTAATGNQELRFYQAIESQMIPDLAYGTSGAKTLTYSFYFKTNKVGLYSVYFQHAADGGTAKRKFLTFTPAASDTWERIVLKVTGDTATAQTMDDNSAGLLVYFTLDNTPNFDIDATEQDWTTSVLIGSENNVNFFDNTSNELYITGCQLEVGDTPSDFDFLPFDIQLQRCQRYFYKNISYADGTNASALGMAYSSSAMQEAYFAFPCEMRTSPTCTFSGLRLYNSTAGNINNGTYSVLSASKYNAQIQAASTSTTLTQHRTYSFRYTGTGDFISADAEI